MLSLLRAAITMAFMVMPLFTDEMKLMRIEHGNYSTGTAFFEKLLPRSGECICMCVDHPHCLSISVTSLSGGSWLCRLYATYPNRDAHVIYSTTSEIIIHINRTLQSAYIENGTQLVNPDELFSTSFDPWIPAFYIRAGNGQRFLWINSSNLTTLTPIRQPVVDSSQPHWFSVLIALWNEGSFIPRQVGLAFMLANHTFIDFTIFNTSQRTIHSWFSMSQFVSSHYWLLENYRNNSYAQTHIESVRQSVFDRLTAISKVLQLTAQVTLLAFFSYTVDIKMLVLLLCVISLKFTFQLFSIPLSLQLHREISINTMRTSVSLVSFVRSSALYS
jgi:hypothetical protein